MFVFVVQLLSSFILLLYSVFILFVQTAGLPHFLFYYNMSTAITFLSIEHVLNSSLKVVAFSFYLIIKHPLEE